MIGLPLATFLAGVGVGLAVAVPIGPMGVLCIQHTLAFGLAAGLSIGLAAATVQVAYSLVAILGLSPTATAMVGTGASLLSALSAATALLFGAATMGVFALLGFLILFVVLGVAGLGREDGGHAAGVALLLHEAGEQQGVCRTEGAGVGELLAGGDDRQRGQRHARGAQGALQTTTAPVRGCRHSREACPLACQQGHG